METYTFLRQLADSWVMLAIFLVFIGVVFWSFRPGSRPIHQDAANSIFRNDKKPAAAEGVRDQRAPSLRQPEEA